MIESLRIENLGTICTAELEFHPGFTVITGETGAGKTMLLTSLDWLLGAKTDSQLVRAEAKQAVVEGSFLAGSSALEVVLEAGGEAEAGIVEASRIVPATARSRAHLGGRTIPAATLARFAEDMVSIHGQSTQSRLRSSAAQRQALDSFGGTQHAQALSSYISAFQQWKQADQRFHDFQDNRQERAVRQNYLLSLLEEFEKIKPQNQDFNRASETIERLSNVESLRSDVSSALMMLCNETDQFQGALDLLNSAQKSLSQAAGTDAHLETTCQLLSSAQYSVSEVVSELRDYLEQLNADPQLLQEALSRRADLNNLSRKLGADPNELGSAWESLSTELSSLDGGQEHLEQLRTELDQAVSKLQRCAKELHQQRSNSAKKFSQAINRELQGLDMAQTEVAIQVQETQPGSSGADNIEFTLRPHAKAPVLPLAGAASGGELSRIMLALEVVLAQSQSRQQTSSADSVKEPRPTLVFDEVDAGIGGQAGIEVGRRLRHLSRDFQVIVVTHLAQVAAFADEAIQVSKSEGMSEITRLSPSQRRVELARMISGNEPTKTALEHADELLHLADVEQSEL